MKKILVVDDEVQILKALSRMFLETDYEIFTAENSMDALKLIETAEIDMIISDMRMPILDGYKLLSTVKEKYPNIIRIIISGYADEKPMFKALLHNVAKLYVFKPWNNDDLLKNINKLFADDHCANSKDLIDKIENSGSMPDIPNNCGSMISQIEKEDIDALILEIEKDPIISQLLIQVAKSAVYGVMPNTVKQAAIYIGLHNLKCFMHWACVAGTTIKADNSLNEPELLWKHSYLTNRIMLFLYEAFLHKQPTEAAMFAGLMHNVGLIILMKYLEENDDFSQTELSTEEYIRFDTDQYVLNHQEIASYYIDKWDLPFPMYEAALYHHRPLDVNIVNQELVSVVHIAQAYAWKTIAGKEVESVQPQVFERIGITKDEFEKRLARYLK